MLVGDSNDGVPLGDSDQHLSTGQWLSGPICRPNYYIEATAVEGGETWVRRCGAAFGGRSLRLTA